MADFNCIIIIFFKAVIFRFQCNIIIPNVLFHILHFLLDDFYVYNLGKHSHHLPSYCYFNYRISTSTRAVATVLRVCRGHTQIERAIRTDILTAHTPRSRATRR
jgi:hypothetical protein